MRIGAVTFVVAVMLSGPAVAQDAVPAPASHAGVPSFGELFKDTGHDFLRLASKDPIVTLAVGVTLSGIGTTEDSAVKRGLTRSETTDDVLDAGATIGGGYVQVGAAFGFYALGRMAHRDSLALVGADLVQAQLVSAVLTQGIKLAADRQRPDGSNYSFPSGHTSATFATADILARRFGWKVGALAYGMGTYVAMSRIAENRHYLSDVLFGAAVGIASSRTVTLHTPHPAGLTIVPVVTGGGAAIVFVHDGSRVHSAHD